jgi:hypothetical protein
MGGRELFGWLGYFDVDVTEVEWNVEVVAASDGG